MYDVHEVPPGGTERSRFALDSSPTGISLRPPENIVVCYQRLLAERIKALEPLAPPSKEVAMRKIILTPAHEYLLIDCPPLTVTCTHKPVSGRGRYGKTGAEAGALLDLAFGGAADALHDDQLWEAARAMAEQERMAGNTLVQFNKTVQLLVLARAGAPDAVPPWELP